jgi:hypothetical protein
MHSLFCISLGISIIFLVYSNVFVTRVSKKMSIRRLLDLVYIHPVENALLYYTFYNLLLCRVFLLSSIVSLLVLVGSIIWIAM